VIGYRTLLVRSLLQLGVALYRLERFPELQWPMMYLCGVSEGHQVWGMLFGNETWCALQCVFDLLATGHVNPEGDELRLSKF
jgi:hypothetical protein